MPSPSEFHYGRSCIIKRTARRVRVVSIPSVSGLVGVRPDTPGMKRTLYFPNELELCAYTIPVGATLIDMLQECTTDYPELRHLLDSAVAEIISLREDLAASESSCDFVGDIS